MTINEKMQQIMNFCASHQRQQIETLHKLPYSNARVASQHPQLDEPIKIVSPFQKISRIKLGTYFRHNHSNSYYLQLTVAHITSGNYIKLVTALDQPCESAPLSTKQVYKQTLIDNIHINMGKKNDCRPVSHLSDKYIKNPRNVKSILLDFENQRTSDWTSVPVSLGIGDEVQVEYHVSGYHMKSSRLAVEYKCIRFRSMEEKGLFNVYEQDFCLEKGRNARECNSSCYHCYNARH